MQFEEDREEMLLKQMVNLSEEIAIKLVLRRLEEHDKDPTVQLLSTRKDETAAAWLKYEKQKMSKLDFELCEVCDPDMWRAKIRAEGMGRSCREEMERLLTWYQDRSEEFYHDAIENEKELRSGDGERPLTESQFQTLGIAACLKYGVRPPKWIHTSHCLSCGTMPAPKQGGECHWCNVFAEIHDEINQQQESA